MSPGPGTYEEKLVLKKKMPEYKIGTGKREDLAFAKQNEFKPAPDSYNPNTSLTKSQTSKWGFGTGKRPNIN